MFLENSVINYAGTDFSCRILTCQFFNLLMMEKETKNYSSCCWYPIPLPSVLLSWREAMADSSAMPSDKPVLHGSSEGLQLDESPLPTTVSHFLTCLLLALFPSLFHFPYPHVSFLESLSKFTTCIKIIISVFGFNETQIRQELALPTHISPHCMPSTMSGILLLLSYFHSLNILMKLRILITIL